mgnify:CR=1 FL=1
MYEAEKTRAQQILSEQDIVCGIAEEAAELGHAALKYRRTMDGCVNVTPVTREEALENINEEIVDVLMYFIAWGYPIESLVARAHNNPKWERVAERLKNGRLGGKL